MYLLAKIPNKIRSKPNSRALLSPSKIPVFGKVSPPVLVVAELAELVVVVVVVVELDDDELLEELLLELELVDELVDELLLELDDELELLLVCCKVMLLKQVDSVRMLSVFN